MLQQRIANERFHASWEYLGGVEKRAKPQESEREKERERDLLYGVERGRF